MLARKCDRCSGLYEQYEGAGTFENESNAIIMIERDEENKYYIRENVDLCPECMQKLTDWMKAGKEE